MEEDWVEWKVVRGDGVGMSREGKAVFVRIVVEDMKEVGYLFLSRRYDIAPWCSYFEDCLYR
jgi:hypothetical protein